MITTKIIGHTDPLFSQAAELRFHVLHEPLGLDHQELGESDELARHAVALEGDSVVGYGRLTPSFGDGQIQFLSVDPGQRGRGTGAEILAALIGEARAGGLKLVWIQARFSAVGFYESSGFEPVGEFIAGEGTVLPHRRMELRL